MGRRAGLGPTYLDFVWPDFKGLNDAGQEVFDLLEVTVTNTPGSIHQEDHIHGCGGRAAELGSGWGRRGGRRGAGRDPLLPQDPDPPRRRAAAPASPSLGQVEGKEPRDAGLK